MLNKVQLQLKNSFAVLAGLCFIFLCFLAVFNAGLIMPLKSAYVALGTFGLALILLLAFWVFNIFFEKLPRYAPFILVGILLFTYLPLQVYVAGEFATTPSTNWDFGIVAGQAMNYVLNNVNPGTYFCTCPNNIPLFFLLTAVFKVAVLFNPESLNTAGIAFNILCLDLGYLFAALTAQKMCKKSGAAPATLLLLLFCAPVLFYTSIYYTDTITFFCPIAGVYFWLCAKEHLAQKHNKKAFVFLAGSIAVLVFGTLLKTTVGIVFVAIIIDIFRFGPLRKTAKVAFAAAALFIILFLPANSIMKSSPIFPEDDTVRLPLTHWVMMGLHGNGGYYDPDFGLSLSMPAENRSKYIWAEICRRIESYGPAGFADHLIKKNTFIYGDGTFYTCIKLHRDRVKASPLDNLIFPGHRYYGFYSYYCQWFMALFLLGALAGTLLLLQKGVADGGLFICSCSLFGLFLFECIWEARSRYLLNFVPVFAVLVIFCMHLVLAAIQQKVKLPAANKPQGGTAGLPAHKK